MLKCTTLVGAQLKPPVGPAKDWMWNGDSVVHSLTRLLGPDGECHKRKITQPPEMIRVWGMTSSKPGALGWKVLTRHATRWLVHSSKGLCLCSTSSQAGSVNGPSQGHRSTWASQSSYRHPAGVIGEAMWSASMCGGCNACGLDPAVTGQGNFISLKASQGAALDS